MKRLCTLALIVSSLHRPIYPEDTTKTVYYAMGIDNLEAHDRLGRAYNLLDKGRPLTELF